MENLNIALIGCGMIGRERIERIQQPHPQRTASLQSATYLKKAQRRALRSPAPAPRFTPISTKRSTIRT